MLAILMFYFEWQNYKTVSTTSQEPKRAIEPTSSAYQPYRWDKTGSVSDGRSLVAKQFKGRAQNLNWSENVQIFASVCSVWLFCQ